MSLIDPVASPLASRAVELEFKGASRLVALQRFTLSRTLDI